MLNELLLCLSLLVNYPSSPCFDNEEMVELIDQRTPFSTTYKNGESYQSIYSSTPIFYLDNNEYKEIDTSFINNNGYYLTKANSNIVKVNNGVISVDETFSFNVNESLLSVNDNNLHYSTYDIYSNPSSLSASKRISSLPLFNTCIINLTNDVFVDELDNGDIHLTNISNSKQYIIHLPYLLNLDNGLTTRPISHESIRKNNVLYINYIYPYDYRIIQGELIENRDFDYEQDYSGTSYIANKYFYMGDSTTYTSNPLIVGKSNIIGPDGNTLNCKAAFNIFIPNACYNNGIDNALFVIKQSSGTASNLALSKVNNVTYQNINGTSSLNTTLIGGSSLSAITSEYTYNIKNTLISAINSNTSYIPLILEGLINNKLAYLFSSSTNYSPYLYLEYHGYGLITMVYDDIDGQSIYCNSVNCMQYAYGNNGDAGVTNFAYQLQTTFTNVAIGLNEMQSDVFNIIKYHFGSDCHVLNAYNSHIHSDERRIAFKLKLDTHNFHYAGDYHFLWQCNDGSWAAKQGTSQSVHYIEEDSVETNSSISGIVWHSDYNSPTLYFSTKVVRQLYNIN